MSSETLQKIDEAHDEALRDNDALDRLWTTLLEASVESFRPALERVQASAALRPNSDEF